MNDSFNNIYILGANRLSTTYYERVIAARAQGALTCNEVRMIDPDPNAFAAKKYQASIICQEYSAFIVDHLQNNHQQNVTDILVPDHNAKHVMLQVFMQIAACQCPQAEVRLSPISLDLNTPFLRKSDDDAIWALSYATWICPADCPEPEICPHTQSPRDWDMTRLFQDHLKNADQHVFHCKQLLHEISFIPFAVIKNEVTSFISRLKDCSCQKFLIATGSRCHGIVGQFEVQIL